MGDFRRDRNFKGRAPHGSRRENGFREKPHMFPAVCAQCGKNCEVPFRPSGDRPVLCSECFGSPRDKARSAGYNGFEKRNNNKPNFERNDRFSPPPRVSETKDVRIDDLILQVEAISRKLDTVVSMIQTNSMVSQAAAALPVEKKAPSLVTKKSAPSKSGLKKIAKKKSAASTGSGRGKKA